MKPAPSESPLAIRAAWGFGRTGLMEVTMWSTEGTNDRTPLSAADRMKVAGALNSRIVTDLGGTRVFDEGDAGPNDDIRK